MNERIRSRELKVKRKEERVKKKKTEKRVTGADKKQEKRRQEPRELHGAKSLISHSVILNN